LGANRAFTRPRWQSDADCSRQKQQGMSVISINKFASLVSETPSNRGICELVRSILVLEARLNNPGEQDFYFLKGRQNHRIKLESMQKQYAEAVEYANRHSIDDLENEIQKRKEEIRHLGTVACKQPVFVKVILDVTHRSKIGYCESLIEAKTLFGKLQPLDELVHDEDALRLVFS
jgi:hypothetical protein